MILNLYCDEIELKLEDDNQKFDNEKLKKDKKSNYFRNFIIIMIFIIIFVKFIIKELKEEQLSEEKITKEMFSLKEELNKEHKVKRK